MLNEMGPPAVPRRAATVMLVRPQGAETDAYEVFLAQRSLRSRFMPGAYVFPGGAVDAADGSAAARDATLTTPQSDGVAFDTTFAALRELFEEAGILLVCDTAGEPRDLGAAERARLRGHGRDGVALASLLRERDLRLDARPLRYYSNWITPASEPIRFDTHFFIAPAPPGQEPEVDAHELHDGRWLTPDDAVAGARSGALRISFPTLAHLQRLATYPTLTALAEHVAQRDVTPFEVEIENVRTDVEPGALAW